MGTHLIDQLHFATELDQAATAQAPWSDWPDLCHVRLLGVIDKVFDEFSPPGAPTLRLDTLEVDLGILASTLSADELEKHLEQALRESLRASLRNAGQGAVTADEQPAPGKMSEPETLEFYLQHGLPPWHADTASTYQLESALIAQAGRYRERIKTLLQTSEWALERSIRQLTDAALAQLLALLNPGSGALPQPLLNAAEPAPDREMRYQLWDTAFRQALSNSVSAPSLPQGVPGNWLTDSKSEPPRSAPSLSPGTTQPPARATNGAASPPHARTAPPGLPPPAQYLAGHHHSATDLAPNGSVAPGPLSRQETGRSPAASFSDQTGEPEQGSAGVAADKADKAPAKVRRLSDLTESAATREKTAHFSPYFGANRNSYSLEIREKLRSSRNFFASTHQVRQAPGAAAPANGKARRLMGANPEASLPQADSTVRQAPRRDADTPLAPAPQAGSLPSIARPASQASAALRRSSAESRETSIVAAGPRAIERPKGQDEGLDENHRSAKEMPNDTSRPELVEGQLPPIQGRRQAQPERQGMNQRFPNTSDIPGAAAGTTTADALPPIRQGEKEKSREAPPAAPRNAGAPRLAPTALADDRPDAGGAGTTSQAAPSPKAAAGEPASKMLTAPDATWNSAPPSPSRGAEGGLPATGQPAHRTASLPLAASSSGAPQAKQASPDRRAPRQNAAIDMAGESRRNTGPPATDIPAAERLAEPPSPASDGSASGHTAITAPAIPDRLVAGQSRSLSGAAQGRQNAAPTAPQQAAETKVSAACRDPSPATLTRDTDSGITSRPPPATSSQAVAKQSRTLSALPGSRQEASPAGNIASAIWPARQPGQSRLTPVRDASSGISPLPFQDISALPAADQSGTSGSPPKLSATAMPRAEAAVLANDNAEFGNTPGVEAAIPGQVAAGQSRTPPSSSDSKAAVANVSAPGHPADRQLTPSPDTISAPAPPLLLSATSPQTAARSSAAFTSPDRAADIAATIRPESLPGDKPGRSSTGETASSAAIGESDIAGHSDASFPTTEASAMTRHPATEIHRTLSDLTESAAKSGKTAHFSPYFGANRNNYSLETREKLRSSPNFFALTHQVRQPPKELPGPITAGRPGTFTPSPKSKPGAIPAARPEATAEPASSSAGTASSSTAIGKSAISGPADEWYGRLGSPAKNQQNAAHQAASGHSATVAASTGRRPESPPAASPNAISKVATAAADIPDTSATPGNSSEPTMHRPEPTIPAISPAEQTASGKPPINATPSAPARAGATDVSARAASVPPSAARAGASIAQATPAAAPEPSAAYWRKRVQERVQGEFARAIERHAGRAVDEARYYRRMLTALADDAPIDPAAIAAQSGDPDDERAAQEADSPLTISSEQKTVASDEHRGTTPASPSALPAAGWIEPLLASASSALGLVVVPVLSDPTKLPGLLEIWPDELFERVFAQLRNPDFDRLLPYAEVMSEACPGITGERKRRLKWQALADALFPHPRHGATADFVVAYGERLAVASPAQENFRASLCANLSGHPERQRVEQYLRYWLLGSRAPQPPAGPAEINPAIFVPGSGIAIGNAGQVLAAPYLPRLFDMLGLLDKGRFAGLAQARRACHLLQFMVDPYSEAAEHQLLLNKLLCGLDIRQPLDAGIELGAPEKTLIEGLLQGIISNWGALGSTSIDGLREAFLQRPGVLAYRDEAWQLKVEKKTLDILMERLPWSFSIIRHSWMKQAVMVEWL
jgi:hypothetical protein